MANSVKTNFTVLEETVRRIETLCADTFRGKGDLIDWLVDQEFARRYSQPNPIVTVEDAQKVQEATK
jgi:hypothetical protein